MIRRGTSLRKGAAVTAGTCYMCESVETSREHVPPVCFFPVAKEFGSDLRRNLITVPSCDRHNSQKSKDDEFLRAVILMDPGATAAAQHIFRRKLLPAVARQRRAYKGFFTDRGPVAGGQRRVLKIDRQRFNECIDRLARAIFFYTFKREWSLPIRIVTPNLFVGSSVLVGIALPHEPTMKAVETLRQYLSGAPVKGENPEVFRYRIRYDENEEAYAFAAQFYGCFEVFSFSSRDDPGSGQADIAVVNESDCAGLAPVAAQLSSSQVMN